MNAQDEAHEPQDLAESAQEPLALTEQLAAADTGPEVRELLRALSDPLHLLRDDPELTGLFERRP